MIIDMLVGVVLLVSAIIAFLRGFIREVLTIAGVVGGVAVSYAVGPAVIVYMDRWLGVHRGGAEPAKRLFGVVPYDVLSNVLSYGLVFLAVVIAISIVSHMIARSARALGLGPVDRTLGFLFGLVRGVVLLALLYLPVSLLVDRQTRDDWFEGSQTRPYLEETAGYISATFLTRESREQFIKQAGKLGEQGQSAREKLEAMDVLHRDGQKPLQDKAQPAEKLPEPPAQTGPGYDENFRQNMNQIFDQEGPSGPAPPHETESPHE